MTALVPLRAKLVRVLNATRPDGPQGERLAAMEAAWRLLRSADTTWEQLLDAEAEDSAWDDWRKDVAFCQRRPALLTEWERGFLHSLLGFSVLSGKQRDRLARIVDKIFHCGSPADACR
jgi:hypothetical protein